MSSGNAKKNLLESFARTTDEIFSLKEFEELLDSKKKIRIKYGVDVTSPFLHIGHAVNLWMMRELQDLGHKVIFLIGDFTTQIGDPTGRSNTRPIIPQAEIDANAEEFIRQAKMVLRFDDPNLLEVRRNSEWFSGYQLADFLKLLAMVTHARLISRDMFQRRIGNQEDIYMHEMIYPILQGYDSYVLESDLTIIGSDQLFNEMLGRFYQQKFGQTPQVIITTKITQGIDGKAKQSKSLDNYIGLGHSSRDKFGRCMKVPDDLIADYLKVYTKIPMDEIARIEKEIGSDPMKWKKFLAEEIIKRYHDEASARSEREWFENTFSKKITPEDIPVLELEDSQWVAIDLLKKFFNDSKSNSDVRRLFKQGAVSINSEKIPEFGSKMEVATDDVVKVGKRIWFKIKILK
ncbi:MAG TPA: tyrosine--tRNA ligase [Nitrospina sp.]|jgi:tyrosyl-tRNA synthetase|nr:tyrosine--tRNA ligase [Nitrospinota bacterium]MDP6335624.1 tyrosine--tRNA ligase [Nitrospinaceae bacterium]HAX47048.1 tyrosine--tRNA ligase [Nitrospina sp.]|tara:strand:- start:5770 stop:6981 length:1212 start_codon:yes stop_codon:yes gene_type:complete